MPAAPATKKRKRNIACGRFRSISDIFFSSHRLDHNVWLISFSLSPVICNKQKKKCGLVRPCPRCIELGLPCTQPIKPEGYFYFTKKKKIDDEPPPFPANLWTAVNKPRQDEHRPQHLPSPSPTVSTVGTPQPSHTSISSYDGSASAGTPARKCNNVVGPDHLDSHTRPRSASSDHLFILTPTEEPSRKIAPARDMSLWDLPAPPEELPDEIVKDSKFSGLPIFGLEKPKYDPGPQADFTIFGEPMDLGEDYASLVDDWEMGKAGEILGGGADAGGMGDLGMMIDKIAGVDAGVASPGVASDAGGRVAWDPDWLDKVDLSNTDLALDDVDLLNIDFPSLDGDILTDLHPSHFSAQIAPQQQSPSAPPPPP